MRMKRKLSGALIAAGVLVLMLIGTAAWYTQSGQGEEALPVHVVEAAGTYALPGEAASVEEVTPQNVSRSLSVEAGDSCLAIFKENGIPDRQAREIIQAASSVFDLSRIQPGHELTLVFTPDEQQLLEVDYEISYLSRLSVTLGEEGLRAETYRVERILPDTYAGPLRQVSLTVRAGDRVYDLLHTLGICDYQIDAVVKAAHQTFDLSGIVPGHTLNAWVTEEEPVRLSRLDYEIDDLTFLELQPRAGAFAAGTRKLVCEVRYARAEGTIESSLYESGIASGLPPEIVMELTDIFAWDINFFTDIRPQDRYSVLYERCFVEDAFKGYGRVVAARFTNQGQDHVGVYFDDGNGARGYYDEHGQPIRKLFLKAPLNYRRISSGFTYHRKHPIYHVARPHLGVDYAAPTGTPVVALGDGKVVFKGWSNGFGNTVRIRHRAGYVTYYGHLSRYARGLGTGSTVDQGQVIGYVGSTGVSTGPHLDFRVNLRGKFINPLRLTPVTGPALSGEALAKFRRIAETRMAMLDDPALNVALNISNTD